MRYYCLLGLFFLLGACRQNEPNTDLLEQATQATDHRADALITGSLGRLYPFAPGSYRATYGPLGELTFVIQ